jgi:prolyl-tRNA editing enzyme YbaK/EbsC (Cys-tRNA(Pro) deacylase)
MKLQSGGKTRTSVTDFFDHLGIRYVVKTHPVQAFSSTEVARERGLRLSQVVKAMVGCDGEGRVIVAMVPGHCALKLKKLRQVAGGIHIELIDRSILARDFGLVVGAISPTQLVGCAHFYMDRLVLTEEQVDISSGSPHAGVQLRSSDLAAALNPHICDIVSERYCLDEVELCPGGARGAAELG